MLLDGSGAGEASISIAHPNVQLSKLDMHKVNLNGEPTVVTHRSQHSRAKSIHTDDPTQQEGPSDHIFSGPSQAYEAQPYRRQNHVNDSMSQPVLRSAQKIKNYERDTESSSARKRCELSPNM